MGMRDTGAGAGYTKHFDETLRGGIYERAIPSLSFLNETSTTQSPDWAIGDRVVLPDGRAFRYVKNHSTAATANPGRLVFNANVIPGIASTHGKETTGAIVLAGATSQTDILDTETRAVDYYAGGFIVMYGTAPNIHVARITGSTAGIGTSVDVVFDRPIAFDISASNQVTLYPSQYSNVRQQGAQAGFAGAVGLCLVPLAVSAFGWIQTWGECWITATNWGSTGPGCATGLRDVYANTDGTIMPLIDSSAVAKQRVGHVIHMGDGSAYGDGMIMLQIAP